MNTFRKLVSQGTLSGGSNGGYSSSAGGQRGDTDLGLTLLRSLVQSVLSKSSDLTPHEKRSKIREILPLILKLFRNSTGTEICAQFEQVAPFAVTMCKLFVEEVRVRAQPSSTVYASRAIMAYLSGNEQAPNTNASSGEFGKNLLLCLEVICSASKQVTDEMVQCNLPSTLVKCIYIFYDLPPTQNSLEGCERLAVKESIRHMLSQLLRYHRATEELMNGEDLALLITSVANFCPPHNVMWRETASSALTTLSVNALTPSVINYIRRKECIRQCIEKMREIGQFSPLEIVEMFVTLFCLLKDSAALSVKLLEDFERHKGYEFLKEFLVKMDRCECEANIDATIRTLALSILSLVYCGESELKPPSDLEIQFSLPDFSIPQPSNRGNSLRNIRAFDVLQQTFINCNTASLLRTILEVISTIYNADVSNFFILYNQKTLVAFAHVIPNKSQEVWAHYFDLLDFVATTLRFVPILELITLSSHLETRSNLDFCRTTLQFMQTLTLFHPIYSKVLNHCDLLRVLTSTLVHFSNHQAEFGLHSRDNGDFDFDADNLSYYHFVIQTLIMILKENETNIVAFKSFGGAAVHHLITPEPTRSAALLLVQTLLCSSIGEDDTSRLIQRLSTVEQTDIKLKVDLLRCLADSLRQHSVVRSRFRLSQGFIHTSSLVAGLTNSLTTPPLPPWDRIDQSSIFQLIETVLQTLTAALYNDPANVRYFNKEVKFEYLVNSVLLLGCFVKRRTMSNYHHVEHGEEYLNHNPSNYFLDEFEARKDLPDYTPQISAVLKLFSYLMKVAIDSFNTQPIKLEDNTPAIIHPGAIISMINLLPAISFPESRQWECAVHFHILCIVQKLVLSCERNAQMLARGGLIRVLIGPIGAVMLLDEHHPSHSVTHSLLDRLSNQRIEVRELRAYLRLGSPLHCLFNEEDAVNKYVPTDDRWRLVSTMGLASSASPHGSRAIMSPRGDDLSNTTDDIKEMSRELKKCECCVCRIKSGSVPLNTIKTLVAMSGKREADARRAIMYADYVMTEPPAFVEFNYNFEGFGSIFIPNLVPHAGSPASFVGSAGTVAVAALSSTASNFVGSPVVPSAPGASAAAVVSLGTGDHRVFPPNNGMSFTCWINMIDLPEDCNHHMRLCTISRNFSAASSKPGDSSNRNSIGSLSSSPANLASQFDFVDVSSPPQSRDLVCFQVGISAVDHSLVVSTKEVPEGSKSFVGLDDPTGVSSNSDLSFRSNVFKQTNGWIHIAVVLTKGFVKQSSCSIFVNGIQQISNRMHYISTPNTTNTPSVYTTNMSIGTSLVYATDKCKLKWKLAGAHLMEDALSSTQIAHMYKLGPSYSGSFQRCPMNLFDLPSSNTSAISTLNPSSIITSTPVTPATPGSSATSTGGVVAIVSEDKIIWGVNARSMTVLSLARIRKMYGKGMAITLSKLLKLSLADEVCPVRVLFNSASHLQGPVRAPLGGVLIGNSSIRAFTPAPLASTLNKIGAPLIVLELIAKSDSIERLYACVKLLNTVLPCLEIKSDMDCKKWFQTLSLILERKAHSINSHVAQIILETIGIVESNFSSPTKQPDSIPDSFNSSHVECRLSPFYQHLALTEVLLNLDIWSGCSSEVQLLVFKSLTSAVKDDKLADAMVNHAIIPKIVAKLRETQSCASLATSKALIKLAVSLLTKSPHAHIGCVAQYIASLLYLSNNSPNEQSLTENSIEQKLVLLRNHSLYCLISEAFSLDGSKLNTSFCSMVQEAIGFDWILLFLCDPKIHESTVVAAFRLLVIILLSPTGMSNFKHGSYNGNWLSITNSALQHPYSNKPLSHFDPQSSSHVTVSRQQSLAAMGIVNTNSGNGNGNSDVITPGSSKGAAADTRTESIDENLCVGGASASAHAKQNGFRPAFCAVNGFDALQYCMAHHTHVTQLYYLLFALTLSKIPIRDPPGPSVQFSGQELCAYADFRYPHSHSPQRTNPQSPPSSSSTTPVSSSANILIEPLQVIIVMLQHAIHKLSVEERSRRESDSEISNTLTGSTSITNIIDSLLQLLQSLNHASVVQFFTAPVLNCITGVLFPPNISYNQCANQRVKQNLLDLLCGIVIQSTLYPLPQKTLPVFDIILDSCPIFNEGSTEVQSSATSTTGDRCSRRSKLEKKQFTTDITHHVMDYVIKAEIMNPTAAALPFTPGGNQQHIPSHLVYLCNRFVDLMWQEMLNKTPSEVIEFLCRLIQQSDFGASQSEIGFYSALNRVLIYDLTKLPNDQLLDQMGTLECFRKYVGKRKCIFAPQNNDLNFLGALCCKIFSVVSSSRNASNREFVLTGCQRLWDTIIKKKKVPTATLR